jgi:hypothetical protein
MLTDSDFEELPECEPTWLRLDRITAYRKQLLAAGYWPLPCNGKAPPIPGWQDIAATDEIINKWAHKYSDALNTGVLTRTAPAVDIDVVDAEVAEELEILAENMLGKSAVRIGQSPKRAILYKVSAPFPKLSAVFISPIGHSHKIEILADGQQIIVNGIHPETGRPYVWHGREPGLALKHDDLPLLTAEKAAAFMAAAVELMTNRGWVPAGKKTNGAGRTGHTRANSSIRERAYARAALHGCAAEFAGTTAGTRNDTLYKKAFRLGTMVSRGWISRDEVLDALFAAAADCGLSEDDGESATRKTIQSGLDAGERMPHPDLSGSDQTTEQEWTEEQPPPALHPLDIHDFCKLAIPKREMVLGPIMPEKGLVMLYAARGTGKTHVGLGVGYAVSTGGRFLKWAAPKARKVLLVDGEMPAQALQERLAALMESGDVKPEPGMFRILAADLLDEVGIGNLATPRAQARIDALLDGAELLILDNLSSLTAVIRDNDAESWNPIQAWLLRLRRRRVSVLLQHHAGKGGDQRGTSRREDVLDTSISLRRPSNYRPDEGARFEVHIEKGRGVHGEAAKPFEATLRTIDGRLEWVILEIEDVNRARVASMLEDGMSIREIADELGIPKSTVHDIKRKIEAAKAAATPEDGHDR